MSNFVKDQPSIRVVAPPGGRSANIFGVPEPEPPMSTKKNHMESDIFGCKKDNTDSVSVKPTRTVTNNIFGADPEPPAPKSNVYSDKNKSTIFDEPPPQQPSNKPDRQRSNIFSTNEPVQSVPTRPVSEKYKSSIFGTGDDDTQTKRGTRQGLRGRLQQTNNQDSYRPSIAISIYSPLRLKDPNASRMGYNPINGESYSTKDGLNSKVEQVETTENEKESDGVVKTPEEENVEQVENGNEKPAENGNAQTPTDTTENGTSPAPVDKPTNGHANGTNGHSTAKNSHTIVRVCHPPGGRSNGPLW